MCIRDRVRYAHAAEADGKRKGGKRIYRRLRRPARVRLFHLQDIPDLSLIHISWRARRDSNP